jgi:hypothetical protein
MTRLAVNSWNRLQCILLIIALFSLSGCNLNNLSNLSNLGIDRHTTIFFNSSPQGASVQDNRLGHLGTTPFEMSLPKGSDLDLTFSLAGYEDGKRDVLNIQESKIVMLELIRIPTYVGVKTTPPGASLEFHTVDGKEIQLQRTSKVRGKQEALNQMYEFADNVNEVVITMQKHGYRVKKETVKIEPKKQNWFSFPLEKITTEISVNSQPSGAEVYEGTLGFLGRTPLNKEFTWEELRRLSIGKDIDSINSIILHLKLSKPNYKSTEMIERMFLDQGDTTKIINVTLAEDSPLMLNIETEPPDADIYEKSLGYLGKSPVRRLLTAEDIARITHRENNDKNGTISAFFLLKKSGYQPSEIRHVISLDGNNRPLAVKLSEIKSLEVDKHE